MIKIKFKMTPISRLVNKHLVAFLNFSILFCFFNCVADLMNPYLVKVWFLTGNSFTFLAPQIAFLRPFLDFFFFLLLYGVQTNSAFFSWIGKFAWVVFIKIHMWRILLRSDPWWHPELSWVYVPGLKLTKGAKGHVPGVPEQKGANKDFVYLISLCPCLTQYR